MLNESQTNNFSKSIQIATIAVSTAEATATILSYSNSNSNVTTKLLDNFEYDIESITVSPATATAIATTGTTITTLLTITEIISTSASASTSTSTSTSANATEISYIPYDMRPETYIVPILFAFIFIVGVVGNGTLIIVFLTVRQMRNVPNTYIFSLALADLLVIITTVPLTSTVYTVDSWPWGSVLCTISEYFKDVSIGVSVFTLTALSGDRYFAIVDPLRKFHAHGGGKRATRLTITIAILIWILAIICGLPALIGTYIKYIDINSHKTFALCYPFPEHWGIKYAKTMVLMRFLIYYAIPLIIIAVFYALIARHLIHAAANMPGEIQGTLYQVRARRKVALTVLAFVLIFGICFLPIHVFMLWFYYWPTAQDDYNTFWHILRIVAFCLSFGNSCANPVALYFVSGAFRKHFNRYLFCKSSTCTDDNIRRNTTYMNRDTSLMSTASKRLSSKRRLSRQRQSTLRSCLQESATTIIPNDGTFNNLEMMNKTKNKNAHTLYSEVNLNEQGINVALKSDNCQGHNHEHHFI